MKKVSIVLASYNRSHMVEKAVRSCLAQTYTNIELIVVDDCSKDNSAEVINSLCKEDRRIKFIQNKENLKLPSTLNIGFKHATGDFFTWTSDDNLFEADAIETMVNILNKEPKIGLVYTDYTTVNEDGSAIARIYQEDPEYLPIRYCIGPCFLYRSEIAKKVGKYNENLALIEDYEFFLRIGLETKILHIPTSHYYYRVHAGSLTQSRKEEIRKAKLLIKEKFSSLYEVPNHLKPIYNLYMWFIRKKTLRSITELLWIIFKNPIITLSYIFKNIVRLKK